jgi:hypothetical protein
MLHGKTIFPSCHVTCSPCNYPKLHNNLCVSGYCTYSLCCLVTLYHIPHLRLYCYCWLTLSLYAAHGCVCALHLLYIYTNKVGKQLKFWPDYTLHFACKPGLSFVYTLAQHLQLVRITLNARNHKMMLKN